MGQNIFLPFSLFYRTFSLCGHAMYNSTAAVIITLMRTCWNGTKGLRREEEKEAEVSEALCEPARWAHARTTESAQQSHETGFIRCFLRSKTTSILRGTEIHSTYTDLQTSKEINTLPDSLGHTGLSHPLKMPPEIRDVTMLPPKHQNAATVTFPDPMAVPHGLSARRLVVNSDGPTPTLLLPRGPTSPAHSGAGSPASGLTSITSRTARVGRRQAFPENPAGSQPSSRSPRSSAAASRRRH